MDDATPLDLTDIEARVQDPNLTPGPWWVWSSPGDHRGGGVVLHDRNEFECLDTLIYDEGGHTRADAEFIAHARTDIPALLAEVRRCWEAATVTAPDPAKWERGDLAVGTIRSGSPVVGTAQGERIAVRWGTSNLGPMGKGWEIVEGDYFGWIPEKDLVDVVRIRG